MNKLFLLALCFGHLAYSAPSSDDFLKQNPFFMACENGDKITILKVIKKTKLINQVDSNGKNCLIYALENEQINFALWLIRNSKIDVQLLTKNNTSPLWTSVDLDLKLIIKELLYKKVNIEISSKDSHQTLLHIAAKIGNEQIVQKIISNKKNKIINLKDNNGDTALIKAVIFDQKEIVRMLLNAKADSSIKNNEDMTALDYAKQNQDEEIIRILQK